MGDAAKRLGFLRWRGMLARAGGAPRRAVAGVLAMACVTMAFTQLGFVGFQFANGATAYLMAVVVPVALSALALGTLPGVAMGLFSGTVLCLHARLMPLDYYELTYVTPGPTIAGLVLFGLVLGSLLSLVVRRGVSGWRRALLVLTACLVASVVLSARFALGVVVQDLVEVVSVDGAGQAEGQGIDPEARESRAATRSGHMVFQASGCALLSGCACLAGMALVERRMRRAREDGLREVFGTHLFVVVLAAFMVVVTGAYVALTADRLALSRDSMVGEVDYLLTQMQGIDGPRAAQYLLARYDEADEGLVLISSGGRVVGTNVERLQRELRHDVTVETLLGADAREAARRSAGAGGLERVVYLAPSTFSNLVRVPFPQGPDGSRELLSQQVGYLVAVAGGDTEVVMVSSAKTVFDGRDDVVLWVVLSTLVLLATVFELTSRLLDRMVARRIDATNAVLGRITEGDLDARVTPEGTHEFRDLSDGINVTVDALKGWIAEAESRMDSELEAARAIQESALPSVDDPFCGFGRFEVYASMRPAREVGGDFFDFFLLGDGCTPEAGRLAFVVADVSGKGVPAALFMMEAKARIRGCLEGCAGIGEAMAEVNRQLCDGNDEAMFVTAWAGVLDYATGRVDYVSAGHNPPLLRQGRSWRWLSEHSGLALGMLDDIEYEVCSVECGAGDLFLLYTDGVTEALSQDMELYGEARLERVVGEGRDLSPKDVIAAVGASVDAFAAGAEQSDDITMLALEVRAGDG